MKRSLKRILSMILIFTLMLSYSSVTAFASDAKDVTDILKNFVISVKQDGKPLTDSDKIVSGKPINVKFSFEVPVMGDGDSVYVTRGDTAVFKVAQGFTLLSGTGPFELVYNTVIDEKPVSVKVGTLNIETDAKSKLITAKIVFDGDKEVFDGSWNSVVCSFDADLEYDSSSGGGSEGDYDVYLLNKTYVVNVPTIPVVISGQKSGVRTGQYIDWKVKTEAKKGSDAGNMSGYEFSDDLSNVGTYEAGTFKVGTLEDGSDAAAITPDFDATVTKLSYAFPAGTTGTRYIFFRTKITDANFYANTSKTITNTAKVLNGTKEEWSGSAPITFDGKWIEKTAADVNQKTGEITWSVTANQMGATLPNAIITDVLDSKLTLVSAEWSTWDNASKSWNTPNSIAPNASGEYSLGTIDTAVLLKIKTKVDISNNNIEHLVHTIKNKASIKWDGHGAIGSKEISVNIGMNPISKSAGGYNASTHTIPWTVKAVKSDINVNLRIMDLLVYSSGGFSTSASYTITNNDTAGLTQVSAADLNLLAPQYNQKYSGNFSSADGLEVTVKTLKNASGKAVADLLVVTGSGGAGIDVVSGDKAFTFSTTVTNPDIYEKNGSTTISNTAMLLSANEKINAATASTGCASNMLAKDMLTVSNAANPAANKNTAAAASDKGFDYVDKSVVFRLHVNANKLTDVTNDITADPDVKLGDVTLTDSLPTGWEFVTIEDGKQFLLYEGPTVSGGKITAGAEPADASFVKADFTELGKVKFKFTSLTKPYVILLKAKPNGATVKEYFSKNGDSTPRNNASLSAEKWTTGTSAYQDVKIKSQILNKTIPGSAKDGVITWTVTYKPYEISHVGTEIKDTLPVGIDLRTDAKGVLDLENDNITMRELTLNADGSYADSNTVPLVLNTNVSYDNTTRVLAFKIPDTNKAYCITYNTDITGDAGVTLTNSVSLISSSASPNPVNYNYYVAAVDVTATMLRSGWVEISKYDGNKKPLAGATFAVLANDESRVLRTGITNADGKLVLRGLPIGEYKLKETAAPAGYNLSTRVYSVKVMKESGAVITSVDGKTGADGNKISVQNIKIGTAGDLTVSKTLAGNGANGAKEFEFTVKIAGLAGDYSYVGVGGKPDGTLTFAGGTAVFTLKGGESIAIKHLPKGSAYTIAEKDYTAEGYLTTKTGDIGAIVEDSVQSAAFTNTRNVGDLTVEKKLAGNAANGAKEFEFTVKIAGLAGDYSYTGAGGKSDGTLTFASGTATFTLKGGESITIKSLLKGVVYTVSEKDYTVEGYVTTKTGETGTISESMSQNAVFTNTRNVGDVTIAKRLSGNAANRAKEFEFAVKIAGLAGDYSYVGAGGKPDGTLTFVDGTAAFTLKGGESITIKSLPKGSAFLVSEKDYTADGYVTTKTGESGVISADAAQGVVFTNSRSESDGGGSDPEKPKTPDEEPKKPTEEEKPQKPEPEKPGGGTEVVEEPKHGTVTIDEDGKWHYKPGPDFSGKDEFKIKITGPDGKEEEQLVTIDEDDVPLAELDTGGTGGELPKTGESSKAGYYLLGICLAAAGIYLRRKEI